MRPVYPGRWTGARKMPARDGRAAREGEARPRTKGEVRARGKAGSAAGVEGRAELVGVVAVDKAVAVDVGEGIAGIEKGAELVEVVAVDEAVAVEVAQAGRADGAGGVDVLGQHV